MCCSNGRLRFRQYFLQYLPFLCYNGQFEYPSEETLTLYRVICEEPFPFICNICEEKLKFQPIRKQKNENHKALKCETPIKNR